MNNKKTIILGITAISLLIIIVSLIVMFLLTPSIKVPDFTNKTLSDVESWIIESEIDEEKYQIEHEFSEEIEKDYVIRQSIEPEIIIKKDEILIITISDGKDPNYIVTIPDFTNITEEEIDKWFKDNLFTNYEFEYISSDNTDKGKFVGINVSEMNQPRSALILISISSGNELVGQEIDMPDLKDYTKTNIQAWAKTNNITVTFKTQSSDKIPEGKVISQQPIAGTKILTGSKITVTLSSGKSINAIDFTGKTKKEAEDWIKENGLKASFTEVYDGKQAEGIIVSNSPSTGSIASGSTVKFNVSKGLVPIDNYTNKNKTDFESYINNLNKQYNSSARIVISTTSEESTSAVGTILSQTINGKIVTSQTMAAPGTTVTIKVASAKKINVVNKAGTSENDFKTYITGLGLKVGSRSEKYDDSKANGILISNDTGSFDLGASINYVVSKGKYTVNVGSLNNTPYSSLVSQINTANSQGAGYSLSKTDVYNDTIVSGNIISCSLNNKTISCNVSKGSQVTVKNYVGSQNPCSPINSCNIDNLIIEIKTNNHDSIPTGQVISQDIAAGTKVDPNTKIKLVVSIGPKPTPTPTPTPTPIPTCKAPSYVPIAPLNGNSYEEAENGIRNIFKDFKNITIIKVTDNPDGFSEGTIKSISPNNLSDQNVDCNTSFTIEIYGKQ